jgi:hypothetical protein
MRREDVEQNGVDRLRNVSDRIPRGGASRASVPCAVPAQSGELAELARLQRGLQRLLHAPGGRGRVDDTAARAIGCDADHVGVYRRMIALRFAREVAREYPATRALLGAARFDAQARAFAETTASRSYTLDGYARAFPRHLRAASGAVGSGPPLDVASARRALAELEAAADVARLERELASARASARRARWRAGGTQLGHPDERAACTAEAPGTDGVLASDRTQASARQAAVPRLEPAPGARLRRFAYDVESALERHGRLQPVAAPPRVATHLAIFRRAGHVERLRVPADEAPMLRALLRGEPLECAVARGVACGLDPDAIREALARWVAARLLLLASETRERS